MSAAVDLRELAREHPERVRQAVEALTTSEAIVALYDWHGIWARDTQLAPDWDWSTWLILAGRGFGKTRTGAEWVRARQAEGAGRIAIVAPTSADARDTMVEGESGLLASYPPRERPHFEPSKRRITWRNGAIATLFSADEPERLRGPQHEIAWCDELAAWRYLADAWDNLMLGLRLGRSQACVTTTPKPLKLIRDLVARESSDVAVTRGTTYENLANVSRAFRAQIVSQYEGTRLGRQELMAEILDDVPGALWTRQDIEDHRVTEAPPLKRVVVGIDPAATATDESNHTGIIGAGLGTDGRGYVLADGSTRGTPGQWARKSLGLHDTLESDKLVAEANQGGDMIKYTLHSIEPGAPVKMVRASRGKRTRAEPVSSLYEQGRVSHVGTFPELEDELCTWDGDGDSPDRLDALVWALTELMVQPKFTWGVAA